MSSRRRLPLAQDASRCPGQDASRGRGATYIPRKGGGRQAGAGGTVESSWRAALALALALIIVTPRIGLGATSETRLGSPGIFAAQEDDPAAGAAAAAVEFSRPRGGERLRGALRAHASRCAGGGAALGGDRLVQAFPDRPRTGGALRHRRHPRAMGMAGDRRRPTRTRRPSATHSPTPSMAPPRT